MTQGGAPDAQGPGPNRVGGRSVWWIAAVLVVAAVAAAFWLTARRPQAPAEGGTTPVAGATSAHARRP